MPNYDIDINEVLQNVDKDGLYKVENFLTPEETQGLKDEMTACFDGINTGEELCYPNSREM